ncbi:MAG: zinc-ribbon domain-containing protein [Candidatus Asgardarchaeia archaeon]
MSTKVCPNCGATIPADATFCPNCGARLTAAAPQPATQPVAPPAPVAQPPQPSVPMQPQPQPMPPSKKKEPILALILSFIIPGLGQMYVGNVKKGIIFLVIAVILYILFWVVGFLFAVYTMYDAYKMAEIYNETGQVPQDMFLF